MAAHNVVFRLIQQRPTTAIIQFQFLSQRLALQLGRFRLRSAEQLFLAMNKYCAEVNAPDIKRGWHIWCVRVRVYNHH